MIFAALQDSIIVPTAVYVIWIVTLAIAVLVILPLVVYLLHRTLTAARNIERYLAEMRDAGVGIASNTQHIKALDDTIAVATQLLSAAESIKSHTGTIGSALTERVAQSGSERRP